MKGVIIPTKINNIRSVEPVPSLATLRPGPLCIDLRYQHFPFTKFPLRLVSSSSSTQVTSCSGQWRMPADNPRKCKLNKSMKLDHAWIASRHCKVASTTHYHNSSPEVIGRARDDARIDLVRSSSLLRQHRHIPSRTLHPLGRSKYQHERASAVVSLPAREVDLPPIDSQDAGVSFPDLLSPSLRWIRFIHIGPTLPCPIHLLPTL